jgi:hypothetical protein
MLANNYHLLSTIDCYFLSVNIIALEMLHQSCIKKIVITLNVAPQISSSVAGTAVILFLGFSKLLSPPTAVEKKHPTRIQGRIVNKLNYIIMLEKTPNQIEWIQKLIYP